MNKSELIAKVAEKAGITKKDAEKAVAGILPAFRRLSLQGIRYRLLALVLLR